MNFNIEKITILLTEGPDKVILHTDFPCPYVYEALPSQQPMIASFDCSGDTAQQYVEKNFPNIPVEVINIRTK